MQPLVCSRAALPAWYWLAAGLMVTAGFSQRWWLELERSPVAVHPFIVWAGPVGGLIISGLVFSLSLMRIRAGHALRRLVVKHARDTRASQRQRLRTEAQLRASLEAVPGLLFEVDLDGGYCAYHAPYVNPEHPPAGLVEPQTLRGTLLPEAVATCMTSIQEAHATGKSEGRYIRMQVPQGSRWFELSVVRKRQGPGSEPRFIMSLKDVTELRQGWLVIQRSLHLQNTIFDTVRTGLIAMTGAGIVTRMSLSAQRLLGVSPEDAKGRVAATLLHSLQPLAPSATQAGGDGLQDLLPMAGFRSLLADARQGGSGASEWTIGHTDGSRFAAELELVPMEGGVNGFLLSITDITERQRDAAGLRAATRLAETANEAKSRFLTAASHDLGQPLSALSLYLGLLKSRTSPENAELMHSVQDCVDSLTALRGDLLDISKLDAGVVKPVVTDFALDELLAGVVSIHQVKALGKGLRFRLRSAAQTARTDRILLHRVIGNFVDNALRYTEQGGVLIACRSRQGRQWVEVWDSGVGIDADKQALVFEEFRSLGGDTQERGTGLGLAIAARMAEVLGLEIRLASRPGRGSMFAIEVPLGDPVNGADSSDAKNNRKGFS